jgi:sulfate adenylyltransferase subunit 1
LNQNITFIPASSLKGDNIVNRSESMTWYTGKTLLEHLESVNVNQDINTQDARFPVQYVIRPHSEEYHDYRGYAGRVISGEFNVGDEVIVYPSERTSTIKHIMGGGYKLESAKAVESITILLEDEIDITRGNMIAKADNPPKMVKEFTAEICWMDTNPSIHGGKYIIQHSNNRVKAILRDVDFIVNTSTLEKDTDSKQLKLNNIAKVQIKTANPLFVDSFSINKANGSFIIIDEGTKNTVAAGIIL